MVLLTAGAIPFRMPIGNPRHGPRFQPMRLLTPTHRRRTLAQAGARSGAGAEPRGRAALRPGAWYPADWVQLSYGGSSECICAPPVSRDVRAGRVQRRPRRTTLGATLLGLRSGVLRGSPRGGGSGFASNGPRHSMFALQHIVTRYHDRGIVCGPTFP